MVQARVEFEQALGLYHPRTATCLARLAEIYIQQVWACGPVNVTDQAARVGLEDGGMPSVNNLTMGMYGSY